MYLVLPLLVLWANIHGSVVLGPELSQHQVKGGPVETVRYVPCPECAKLMNRINFAKRSGVIPAGASSDG